MQLTISAILFSTFLWWFSTGVIFYLNARSPSTFRWSMLGGSLVLAAAIYGIHFSAALETVGGAFLAFTCGLLIWGWHTMSYYMGVVTGPRREACPEGCTGAQRFKFAVATSLYHELAIIATAGLLVWMTWGHANAFGLWTFLGLWGMHVSAKLNVFLGVRNLNIEFIPKRLGYLTTYFRKKRMNALFPFSITIGTVVTALLALQAVGPGVEPFQATGFVLLATLMALAVIEHGFMVLPIPADALWRWSLDRRSSGPKAATSRSASPTTAAADIKVRTRSASA